MAKTQLIFTDNPGAVPASYVIPGGLDLVLQSIVARFNGAAAGGAFLPVLAVYSQDGKLMGRFHPNTELAVGDTAVVTYAPFLKASEAAAGSALPWARYTPGAVVVFGFVKAQEWASVATSDTGLFAISGSDVKYLQINANGTYELSLAVTCSIGAAHTLTSNCVVTTELFSSPGGTNLGTYAQIVCLTRGESDVTILTNGANVAAITRVANVAVTTTAAPFYLRTLINSTDGNPTYKAWLDVVKVAD